MSKFYIGQEVVCVDDSRGDNYPSPIKKGESFIIKGLDVCECGQLSLDIGISTPLGSSCKCDRCSSDGIWWFFSERFVPVDYNSVKQVTFKEIVEDIPVVAN